MWHLNQAVTSCHDLCYILRMSCREVFSLYTFSGRSFKACIHKWRWDIQVLSHSDGTVLKTCTAHISNIWKSCSSVTLWNYHQLLDIKYIMCLISVWTNNDLEMEKAGLTVLTSRWCPQMNLFMLVYILLSNYASMFGF